MYKAHRYMCDRGIVDEECFPYVARNAPCSDICDDWKCRLEINKCWGWIAYGGIASEAQIKQAVMNDGPVSTLMEVYNDFFYYNGGVYKHVSGGLAGYHGVVILGWHDDPDPDNNYWICKNSWGTGWGEGSSYCGDNGWFRIIKGTNHCLIRQQTSYKNPRVWADLNEDASVDRGDYMQLRTMLGKCEGDEGYSVKADYDNDCCITYGDLRLWYGYFLKYHNGLCGN